MELINATRFQAAYTMGTEPSAREHIVVAVKGTFAFLEEDGEVCPLAGELVPLVMADEYWGEPGHSALRYGVDLALRKHRCEVLLNAAASARIPGIKLALMFRRTSPLLHQPPATLPSMASTQGALLKHQKVP